MYTEYFNLSEIPFLASPDPAFFYGGKRHQPILEGLIAGVEENIPIMVLSGEKGYGKTTLGNCLYQHYKEKNDVILVQCREKTVFEVLETICNELNIFPRQGFGSIRAFMERISEYLQDAREHRKKIILIIDEAQNLDVQALNQLYLLSALENDEVERSLTLILAGDSKLNETIEYTDFHEINNGLGLRFGLDPLPASEVDKYISHRLQVAGNSEDILFQSKAVKRIAKLSGGVPRVINQLCDRALLSAFAVNGNCVDATIVNRVAGEILPDNGRSGRFWATRLLVGSAAMAFLLLPLYLVFLGGGEEPAIPEPVKKSVAKREKKNKPVENPALESQGADGPVSGNEKSYSARVESRITMNPVEEKGSYQKESTTIAISGNRVVLSSYKSKEEDSAISTKKDPFKPIIEQSVSENDSKIRISSPLLVLGSAHSKQKVKIGSLQVKE